MRSDKANKKARDFETQPTSFSPIGSFYDQATVMTGKKWGNVLPLERPRPGLELVTSDDDAGNGTGVAAEAGSEVAELKGPASGTETAAEIKTRMEAVLARIKSRAATTGSSVDEATGQAHAVQLKAGESEPGSTTIAGFEVKNFAEAIEKRLAEVFAAAREAEARAREAEEKYHQAEAQFKQEAALRLLAEQRVRDAAEEARQWLSTAEEEEAKRRQAETERDQAETRGRAEAEARAQAEKALAEAEARAQTAALALAEAEKQKAEAEARARAAEETAREVEALMYEADAIAREVEEKYQAAEGRLQGEVELRVLAEQKLKALEEELSRYLDLNLSQLQTDFAGFSAERPLARARQLEQAEESNQQLGAQIEAEQKARKESEQACDEAETRASEMETLLRKAEEKYRQSEAGFKKIIRKQEAELRILSEQVARAKMPDITNEPAGADEFFSPFDGAAPGSPQKTMKLVSFAVLIALLLAALTWLGITAYQQF